MGQGLWLNKKGKIHWAPASVPLCFLTTDITWPATSCSHHHGLPIITDPQAVTWSKPFLLQVLCSAGNISNAFVSETTLASDSYTDKGVKPRKHQWHWANVMLSRTYLQPLELNHINSSYLMGLLVNSASGWHLIWAARCFCSGGGWSFSYVQRVHFPPLLSLRRSINILFRLNRSCVNSLQSAFVSLY